MSEPYAIGVDRSSGTWLAVAYENDEFAELCVHEDIEAIWEHYHEIGMQRMVVDAPIGLFQKSDAEEDEELVRRCDVEARKIVGPQYRSIFNPPCRDVIEDAIRGSSYHEVKGTQREVTNKGLTQQAYAISRGIYQLDQLLCEDDDSRKAILEGHPEVCFRAFAEDDIEYPKSSVTGVAERLSALGNVQDDPMNALLCIGRRIPDHTDRRIGVDDVLDAMALAVTAGASDDKLGFLPVESENPPEDEENLPMQMVYRSSQEFEPIDD